MANCELVAGDGGSKLHVTITDKQTHETIDLTGKTIKLRYSLNGAVTEERGMTALNQTIRPGEAEYQFLTTDLSAAGVLRGEVRLQSGQPDQLTTVDEFHLAIRAPLP